MPADNPNRLEPESLHPRLPTRVVMLVVAWLLTACGGSVGSPTSGGDSNQPPDPVAVDFPLAYVQRPLPLDEDGEFEQDVITEPAAFRPGAALYLQERATPVAARRNLTASIFGANALYDVKDLSVHPDGDRLLFALRAPEVENADDEDQPTWNIWEYHLETDELRRVISSDLRAEAGQDVAPLYLPDGRIVFSSTRQSRSRAILLDDGKPQFAAQVENDSQSAFVLHVMYNDGSGIEQLSFNQSHDLHPTLLPDGRILFTRWDGFGQNRLSFYTLNPDGTGLASHYGYHSLNEEDAPFLYRPRTLDDGRLLAVLKPRDDLPGGDLVTVDIEHHHENRVTLWGDEIPVESEQTAQRSLTPFPIPLQDSISRHGLYRDAYPMYDGSGRLLVSWSQCRLRVIAENRLVPCTADWLLEDEDGNRTPDEGTEPAPPLFGLWVYDPAGPTQQPVVLLDEGLMATEPVILEPRTRADFIPPHTPDSQLLAEGVGVLHIRSLYDRDGTDTSPNGIGVMADPLQTSASQRPLRFLRLLKAVSRPDGNTLNAQDDDVFGRRFGQNGGLFEILGYVPVEPDGSVMARVPADVAFSFELVNAAGQRVAPRHNNWLQLRAGEVRHCQGCHDPDSSLPHGRSDAQPTPAYFGAPTSGAPFANTRRLDPFGSPEFPDLGETMAEFDARIAHSCTAPDDPLTCTPRGPRSPEVDLRYTDIWTDPNRRQPDPPQQLLYAALAADDYRELIDSDDPDNPEPLLSASTIQPPASDACQQQWHSLCRVIIHYEHHIQPLWQRQRLLTRDIGNGQRELVPDSLGAPIDHTCTGCHSDRDADEQIRVPPGQLELVATRAGNGMLLSYLELLNTDVELIIEDGALVPRLIETGEFQRDEDGELILDDEGQPIPVLTTVPVPPSMSRAGAGSSPRFFNRFFVFDPEEQTVDHRGMLNSHELRLLREWLDLGGRYHSNPFDRAPEGVQ